MVGIRLGMEKRMERPLAREWSMVISTAVGETWMVFRWSRSMLETIRCPRMGCMEQRLATDILD